jgi:hypothetical protein
MECDDSIVALRWSAMCHAARPFRIPHAKLGQSRFLAGCLSDRQFIDKPFEVSAVADRVEVFVPSEMGNISIAFVDGLPQMHDGPLGIIILFRDVLAADNGKNAGEVVKLNTIPFR